MSGKDPNGSETRELPRGQRSAVKRLNDLKAHQWSPLAEIRHNWRGWLGSLVFHAAIVAVLMTITWTILIEEREYIIMPTKLADVPDLKTRPLNELFKHLVESEKHAAPEVPAEVIREDPGYTEDEPGVPNYLTVGGHLTGPWGKSGEAVTTSAAGRFTSESFGTRVLTSCSSSIPPAPWEASSSRSRVESGNS